MALVACGAIAQPCAEIARAEALPIEVHPLPPLLHNQPHRIAEAVTHLGDRLASTHARVAVGYADCGTYGALDRVCDERGWHRLPGLHCYDLYAGADEVEHLLAQEPGTYLLTDFLVRSFARTVLAELGLDRYPQLRDDYFRHYRRVLWLAQSTDSAELAELRTLAHQAAQAIGLPLQVRRTGTAGLARALRALSATP